MNHKSGIGRAAFVLLAMLLLLNLSGCCARKNVGRQSNRTRNNTDQKQSNASTSMARNPSSGGEQMIAGNEMTRALRPQDQKTKEQYQRLEYAFSMYNVSNFDGALREVERLQLEINQDPYLEMQSWYLSAMIYHKTDKISRRKRAMRKMLETMEQVQKDPRYRNAYADGMISQEMIKLAKEKGDGRYAEFAE
ncbi:MAG TPA: hypothetical protein PLM07_07580 [Candidatus Rifleibacterium sp.]|nr:hypothetical protein [Candidatus Rifleibacterium sp.]HPT45745.1 hypothetical protein [Candidatus Rifleibacterium sp.]